MANLLSVIGYFGVIIFIITSMLVMGLNVTVRDLLSPLRNKRLMILSLLANFVMVPLLAFILIYIFPISAGFAMGLILVSIAAGAPSTPKVAEFTGGNIAYAVSLTLLMTILTIVLMPFLVPYLMEGAGMDPTKVAFNLVVLMLIPIFAGIILRDRAPGSAGIVLKAAELISNVSIGVIFLTYGILFLTHLKLLFGGPGGLQVALVALLFTIGALLIGYFMGGSDRESRGVLAFGTGFRNVTAALVVITASYSDPTNDILLMVLMVTIFSVIIVSTIVGIIFKKRMDVEKRLKGQII
jgi:predicted Na+-dependent transporter